MNRLLELASRLSPAQLKEVEDFAEFLGSRNGASRSQPRRFLDVDKIAGFFEGLAPEKTSVELAHEATEAMTEKYEKQFK